MHKLLMLLLFAVLLAGCGPAYYYPVGATEMEKWQIDRYYEDRYRQPTPAYTPTRYCNDKFCW